MKKLICLLLVALLVAALPMSALAAGKTVYISSTGSGSLNLRSGPGKDYSVKGYVFHGDTVTVQDSSGEWSKVKVDGTGKTGWIKTKYINGTTKDLGTGTKTVKVPSGDSLNLRSGPGTSYATKGKVKNGATVKVLGTEDDWVKITDKGTGKTGWIMAKYIGGASSGGSSSGGSSSSGSSSSGGSGDVYRVTGTSLNVRAGAGTGYKVVDTLKKGTAFKATGASGNWLKIVTFGGVSGWLSKSYVSKGATATVTATSLNVRAGAGTGYKVVGAFKHGASVTVDSISGNWAHVTGSVSGYVSLNYIKF